MYPAGEIQETTFRLQVAPPPELRVPALPLAGVEKPGIQTSGIHAAAVSRTPAGERFAGPAGQINATVSAHSHASVLNALISREASIFAADVEKEPVPSETGKLTPKQELFRKEISELSIIRRSFLPVTESELFRLSAQIDFLDHLPSDLSKSPEFEADLVTVKRFFLHAAICNDVYLDKAMPGLMPEGWHRMEQNEIDEKFGPGITHLNDDGAELNSALYTNGMRVVCANRGSMPDRSGHWVQNAQQAFGKETPIYQRAISNAKILADKIAPLNLEFAGHSLGGGLASAQCAATNGNSAAFTFNPAGLHSETKVAAGLSQDCQDEQLPIVDYQTEGCWLTELQRSTPYIPDNAGIVVRIPPHRAGDNAKEHVDGQHAPISALNVMGAIDRHLVPYASDCIITKFVQKYPEIREAHGEFCATQAKALAEK